MMRTLLAAAAAAAATAALALASATHAETLAIVGGTLIDVADMGRSSHDRPNTVILIHDGVIAAVGDRGRLPIPAGARVIDAAGGYVTPGLIDGFGGMRGQGFADAYLYEGVTTVYVTHTPTGDGEQQIAAASGPRLLRAEAIAGYARGGAVPSDVHPWTDHRHRDTPRDAADLVREIDDLADHGARGLLVGFDVLPDQLPVIVREAKRRHMAVTMEPAFTPYAQAVGSGVQAFVRNDRYETALATPEKLLAYADDPMGRGVAGAFHEVCAIDLGSPRIAAFADRLTTSRTALMPILSIEATADDVGAPNPWLSRSAAFITPAQTDDPVDPKTGARPYLESHPDRREALRTCAIHRQEIDRAFHRLGVTYLVGSGAPGFGIMPGGGVHQELRLLQHIGLTPREALAAATGNFAAVYGWTDVGRIEAGRAGDVVIVGSDPRLDVAAMDDIRTVIHDGHVVDRAALLAGAKGYRPAG